MTGNLTTKRMRAKTTGRRFTYEIYQTADGKLWTARLIVVGSYTLQSPIWGDVCDDETAAIKSAFHAYADPVIERQKRDADYYRSGGY